jgi:mRNA interferase MazF
MDLVVYPQRGEVWLVSLEPTIGSEIRKTRPGVIVSPNETNKLLRTVIVAPLTSTIKSYPTRLNIVFQNRTSSIALDQIRTLDKSRLIKKLGKITLEESQSVADILVTMFSI